MPRRHKGRQVEDLLVEDISIEDLDEIENYVKRKHDELETLEMEILRDYTDESTLYSDCDSRKCSSAVALAHGRYGVLQLPSKTVSCNEGWWVTFVMLVYLLDAELPSSFYVHLVKTKTFGKLMNDLSSTQRHLIKKMLHQNEGSGVSREWSLSIRDIREKISDIC